MQNRFVQIFSDEKKIDLYIWVSSIISLRTMQKIKTISNWIENYSEEIIKNIEQESIDVYNFLKKEFNNSNVSNNHLFQFVYRSFYRLDNAGLTQEFKNKYFQILEEYRNESEFHFEKVLQKLYHIPNIKGNEKTFQFSFVTKMYNIINDSIPIYDSKVAKVFSMSKPHQKEFEIKLSKHLEQLKQIQKGYEIILEQNLLPKTIKLFDSTFKDNKLSEMKKLDFIFWSSGKIKDKEQKAEKVKLH